MSATDTTPTTHTVENNDTGSLKIGAIAVTIGDRLQLEGEGVPRIVSYLMGKGARTHACARGTGAFPVGRVTFTVIKAG